MTTRHLSRILFGLALFASTASAQQNVQQTGSITPGHAPIWTSDGIIADGGSAEEGSFTSLGVTNNGGPGFCVNSAPVTAAYNQLCLSATTNGGTKISSYTYGGATTPGITFDINGSTQGFLTVTLPVAANDFTCFSDTSGNIKSCTTIANNTVLGNVSGGAAQPTALTAAQITASLCNQFTTTLKGCVPASGGGTSNFLRADGTWTAPPTAVVNSVSNSDGTLTVGPTTGDVVASLNLSHANTWAAVQSFNSGDFKLNGATSGTLDVRCAGVCGTNTLTLPAGTTDFSATGGTSQVVKQTSSGGALSVAQLAASDLSNGTTGTGAVVLATSPTVATPTISSPTLSGTVAGNLTWSGTQTIANTETLQQQVQWAGIITPTALSGNVNDYNPTGLATANTIRLSGGAADRNITGLTAQPDGTVIDFINIGTTNNLTLVNQSASSSAANRFLLPADTVLPPNTAIALRYDATAGSTAWRPWSRALSNTGVTAGSYGTTTNVATFTVGSDGRLTAAANAAIPTGAPATLGLMRCDNSTITCASGLLTAVGAVASSIGVGSTTITSGTSGRFLYDGAGTLSEAPVTGSLGNVVLSTNPTISTGSITSLGTFSLRDTSAAFDVTLAATSSSALTAGRTLTIDVVNAARTAKLGSNLTIASDPGTVSGAMKSNGTGTFSQAACADISNGGNGGCAMTYAASTWTPTITTDGTVGTPAYSIQTGSYEQIGRLVMARFRIALSGWTGSPTGNVYIGGLPFTASTDYGTCNMSLYNVTALAANNYGVAGYVAPTTTTAAIVQSGNSNATQVTAAQAGTTASFTGTCFYRSS